MKETEVAFLQRLPDDPDLVVFAVRVYSSMREAVEDPEAGRKTIAESLRTVADRVERGEYGAV